MRILVTRPQPDGERTASALRARGHEVLLAPLTRIEPIAADIGPGPFAAILITSANAARVFAQDAHGDLLARPVYAVGAASADAMRAAGFSDVTAADGDAASLVQLVRSRVASTSAPLLYLAGEDRAADVSGDLAAHGLQVQMAVIYRAAANSFPPEAVQALASGSIDAVLHYSRRSATLYLAGARAAGIETQALAAMHYCFAPGIAAVLERAGADRIAVAPRIAESAMLALIGSVAA